MSLSISKRILWHYVNKKIKGLIHHYHVFSIISILFEEMVKDLKNDKEIKIANFGILVLKNLPPRTYHDVRYNKVMKSPGHRALRLFLAKQIRKKLCDTLDIKLGDD